MARRTREALLVCEAAGFDVVIVETVGVGQSETAVAGMVDVFLLLLQPGGGDELQGFKRGIIELADLVVVTKADGELEAAARRAAAEYQGALGFLRPPSPAWRPPVLLCSAATGAGIAEVWDAVERFRAALSGSGAEGGGAEGGGAEGGGAEGGGVEGSGAEGGGALAAKRAEQARAWMWSEVSETLVAALSARPEVARQLAGLEDRVRAGTITPAAAAARLLEAFRDRET